jgi:hypothetical protein
MDPVDESLIEAQEEGASTFCRRKRIARAGENTMLTYHDEPKDRRNPFIDRQRRIGSCFEEFLTVDVPAHD